MRVETAARLGNQITRNGLVALFRMGRAKGVDARLHGFGELVASRTEVRRSIPQHLGSSIVGERLCVGAHRAPPQMVFARKRLAHQLAAVRGAVNFDDRPVSLMRESQLSQNRAGKRVRNAA